MSVPVPRTCHLCRCPGNKPTTALAKNEAAAWLPHRAWHSCRQDDFLNKKMKILQIQFSVFLIFLFFIYISNLTGLVSAPLVSITISVPVNSELETLPSFISPKNHSTFVKSQPPCVRSHPFLQSLRNLFRGFKPSLSRCGHIRISALPLDRTANYLMP